MSQGLCRAVPSFLPLHWPSPRPLASALFTFFIMPRQTFCAAPELVSGQSRRPDPSNMLMEGVAMKSLTTLVAVGILSAFIIGCEASAKVGDDDTKTSSYK